MRYIIGVLVLLTDDCLDHAAAQELPMQWKFSDNRHLYDRLLIWSIIFFYMEVLWRVNSVCKRSVVLMNVFCSVKEVSAIGDSVTESLTIRNYLIRKLQPRKFSGNEINSIGVRKHRSNSISIFLLEILWHPGSLPVSPQAGLSLYLRLGSVSFVSKKFMGLKSRLMQPFCAYTTNQTFP